jgi:hypothetical protein
MLDSARLLSWVVEHKLYLSVSLLVFPSYVSKVRFAVLVMALNDRCCANVGSRGLDGLEIWV